MDQSKELFGLIEMIAGFSDDILIYTGYRIEELKAKKDVSIDNILKTASVIIDGEYIEALNNNSVLRGSSNQNIHILNKKYDYKYQRYLNEIHNQIQNFTTADGVVSVGIHHPTF